MSLVDKIFLEDMINEDMAELMIDDFDTTALDSLCNIDPVTEQIDYNEELFPQPIEEV
nr:MAG TPA: hypothetical protein [Caudoviricetes sp.]